MSRSLTFITSAKSLLSHIHRFWRWGLGHLWETILLPITKAYYPCSRLMRGAFIWSEKMSGRGLQARKLQWEMVSCLVKRNRLISKSEGWEEYVGVTASRTVLKGLGKLLRSHVNMEGLLSTCPCWKVKLVLLAAGTSAPRAGEKNHMGQSWLRVPVSTLPSPMISPASHCFLILGPGKFVH